MSQIWTIGGRDYNWSQLQELKKKNLDPQTAVVQFVAPEEVEENEEIEQDEPELPTNYMQLKKLAKEKGMNVTNDTKKDDILTYLKAQK